MQFLSHVQVGTADFLPQAQEGLAGLVGHAAGQGDFERVGAGDGAVGGKAGGEGKGLGFFGGGHGGGWGFRCKYGALRTGFARKMRGIYFLGQGDLLLLSDFLPIISCSYLINPFGEAHPY